MDKSSVAKISVKDQELYASMIAKNCANLLSAYRQ